MTIYDLKELPIPEGFPEKMKEVLRRKNASLMERKRLIEEEVSYNDFTIKTFEKYIKDFQTLYPGILTDDEIMKRLKANIKHDITYSYIKNSNGENNKNITGYFDATTHSVILNKDYYESLKDKSVINRTIFHELTHALVEKNPYDYNIEHEAYENANFVSESIITIMEEDYVRVIEGRKVKRVNGYIPTYAHELRAIYGNDLIKHFVGDFKHIDPLFFRDEETYESFGTEIIPIMDSIYFGVREVKEDVDVSYYNKLVELGISSLLDEYLSTTILFEEQKLKKITDLAKLQIYPDFNIFQEMIHKYIKDESLIKNDFDAFQQQAPYIPEITEANETLLKLLAQPTIASKEWVYEQYDYMVQTNYLRMMKNYILIMIEIDVSIIKRMNLYIRTYMDC